MDVNPAAPPEVATPSPGISTDPPPRPTPTESALVDRIKQAEKWMIILTAIIALATIANVFFFVLESTSSTKSVDRLTEEAKGIVGTMDQALSDNRKAISKAFEENKRALDAAAERDSKVLTSGEKSIGIAAEQMELSQRPWLRVKAKVDGPLYYDQHGANLQVDYVVTNTGNSPAVHVRWNALLQIVNSAGQIPTKIRDHLCESVSSKKGLLFNESISPRDGMEEHVTTSVSPEELNKAKSLMPFFSARPMFCVAYESQFMPEQHYYTGVYFELESLMTNKQGKLVSTSPYLYEEKPADQLLLRQGAYGPAILVK
jgi:hypothetical protein